MAFSVIPDKTPWNLLPFYAGIVMMAGIGASALVVIVLVAAGWQLAAQGRRASFQYPVGDRYVSEFYGLRPGVVLTL